MSAALQSDGHIRGYRLGYRPEIEGLRAIAVLLVVAAHAGMPGLAGGFVGVDIFLVLSGYLITGLLLQEIHETGSVALTHFYAKRLLRLLPALLLMICTTGLLGWFLLPAIGQSFQAAAAASAALWLSNLHFALRDIDYFSPESDSNLFLHTWSLGVEEQFYLVWPVFLILALGLWRHAGQRPRLSLLSRKLWLVLFASFALGLYWFHTSPAFAFYMMPSRAWQFALGALVFMHFGAPAFQAHTETPTGWHAPWLTGWAGLSIILATAWHLSESTPYPGPWALLPSIGTALVLIPAGRASSTNVWYWLSLKPMQAIGRISYSWYLWHWPVLLLGATVVNIHNGWNRAALVLLSLGIATASWRYFEVPLRRQQELFIRPRLTVFVSLALMMLSGSLAMRWGAGADAVMRRPILQAASAYLKRSKERLRGSQTRAF